MNKRTILIIGILALFVLNFIPGTGTKASDQQAIVSSKYTCAINTDCPSCVGAVKGTNQTFFDELTHAECEGGICQMSSSCLVWDCGNAGNCNSIRQSVFDNTIMFFNSHVLVLLLCVGLVVGWFYLK